MSSKISFLFFFILPLLLANAIPMFVNAYSMSFVEVSVSPNRVRTGETFTLFAVLVNNSTEVVSGRLAHVITNRTYTKGWGPPRTISFSSVSSSGVSSKNSSFGPIKPGEHLNCTIVLRPLQPGKFLIYVEATVNGGVLRSNSVEVEAYGESIVEGPLAPFQLWMVGVLTVILGSALGFVFWFKPILRAKVVSGFKGLRVKFSETVSTLLAISLILASPYIAQPFLYLMENPTFASAIFLRTYYFLLFFGLPAFTILHGFSTKMPTRSFLVAFAPIIIETLISNLTRPYPFVPFNMVILKFIIALFLGLIGAGAALTQKRRKNGYILLTLGIILWTISTIGGFIQAFL